MQKLKNVFKKKNTYCFSLPKFLTSRWENCFQLQACCFPTGYKSPVAFQQRSKYLMFSHQGKSSSRERHQTLAGPGFCLPAGWQPRQLAPFFASHPDPASTRPVCFEERRKGESSRGMFARKKKKKKKVGENSIAVLPGSVTVDSNKVTACK